MDWSCPRRHVELPEEARQRLRELTPWAYIGNAAEQARNI